MYYEHSQPSRQLAFFEFATTQPRWQTSNIYSHMNIVCMSTTPILRVNGMNPSQAMVAQIGFCKLQSIQNVLLIITVQLTG